MKRSIQKKSELIRISAKYVTPYNNVDFTNFGKELYKRYVVTNATKPQLKKIDVPYHVGYFGVETTYNRWGGKYHNPVLSTVIRKKDAAIVEQYLLDVKTKKEEKYNKTM